MGDNSTMISNNSTKTTLDEWLAHCERLHPQNIDMGLDRVRQVANAMALRFAVPVITVAGTNGKGSTCAMLEACLLQAGYRPGVYTSPHLVHFEVVAFMVKQCTRKTCCPTLNASKPRDNWRATSR